MRTQQNQEPESSGESEQSTGAVNLKVYSLTSFPFIRCGQKMGYKPHVKSGRKGMKDALLIENDRVKKYQSKVVDFDKKISIKIDRRTHLLVDPHFTERDISRVKKLYSDHMKEKLKIING